MLKVCLFMLLGFGVGLHAQITIAIHDSSLTRSHHAIPVYGTVQVLPGDSLELLISVDPRMIDLDSVVAAQPAVRSVTSNFNILRPDSALIRVQLHSNALSIVESPLVLLYLNLLAGPDTLTTLRPFKVFHNDSLIESSTLHAGLLHYLNSDPVHIMNGEYIGVTFPNPGIAPKIRFRLINACAPHFSLFDSSGRLMVDEVMSLQNSGSGVFQFSSPDYAALCDGVYFVRMITPVGVYVAAMEVIQ